MKTQRPGRSLCRILALSSLLGATLARAQQARDSAGIQIVDNSTPVWTGQAGWKVSPTPIVDIGADPGDPLHELSRVTGVGRLSDGRIVVANASTATIRVFDPGGRGLTSFGRRGKGPGELGDILSMEILPGDTIVVVHTPVPPTTAAVYFDSHGRFIRSTPIFQQGSTIISPTFFADGSYAGVLYDYGQSRGRTGTWLDSVSIVRRASERTQPIVRMPYQVKRASASAGYGMTAMFAPRAQLVAHGLLLYAGYPSVYEVRVYAASGRLQRIIRRAWSAAPVPRAAAAQYHAWYLSHNRIPSAYVGDARREMEAKRQTYIDQLQFATTLPAYDELLVDARDHLWVRRPDVRHSMASCEGFNGLGCIGTFPDSSQWDVFDPAGRWFGAVTFPASFTPTAIDAQRVIGVWRDEDGVEHARVYALSSR